VLPIAAMTLVFAPMSGRLVGNRGPRRSLIAAGIALAASGIPLTRLTATTPAALLILAYAVFGFGLAMVNAPITNTAMSGMPRSQAGVAAATASTSRQIGQSLGVAITGSVVISSVHGPLRSGFPAASHPGWWLITTYGLGVLISCFCWTHVHGWGRTV
jgi:MFS family permease